MIKLFAAGALVVLSVFLGHAALATDIGIVREDSNSLALVDTTGEMIEYPNALSETALTLFLANKTSFFTSDYRTDSNKKTWSGDFLSNHDGLEYIKTDNQQVKIFDSAGNLLDQFETSGLFGARTLGVGDVFQDIPGQEILVCRQAAKHPHIKVYSYDETTGEAAEQLSFIPFQDLPDRGLKHGCASLDIATIDGTKKIVTISLNDYGKGMLIYIYNIAGELEQQIAFNSGDEDSQISINLDIADFSGDGIADDVVIYNGSSVRVYNLVSGAMIASEDLSDHGYVDYGVGNIDGEVGDEIIVMYGKKCNVYIWSVTDTTDLGQFYPSETKNRHRKIVIDDFSSVVE